MNKSAIVSLYYSSIILFLLVSQGFTQERITFMDATPGSTFADLFVDAEDAEWYQLWFGNSTGTKGSFIDTGNINNQIKGWIKKNDLSRLIVDFAQANAETLWVRPWDSLNGAGSWYYGFVDFSAATRYKITSSVDCTVPIAELFIDHNVSEGTWYQMVVESFDGSINYVDTSSLNQYGNGWIQAEHLSDFLFPRPEEPTTQTIWVRVFNKGRYYGWTSWEIYFYLYCGFDFYEPW